jgi:hypothetical protein
VDAGDLAELIIENTNRATLGALGAFVDIVIN